MEQRVLILIPAFNEEDSISALLLNLKKQAPQFDRLVINDGSVDQTGKIVHDIGERQLSLPCNLGYGPALQAGMMYALQNNYDIVVTLDADGQHDPRHINDLLKTLKSGAASMVIGSRYCNSRKYDSPWGRRTGQILFSLLTAVLAGKRIYDTSSGYKAMDREVCNILVKNSFVDFHTESIVRLSMMGYHILEVPVQVMKRAHGKSMHSVTSLFKYPLKTLLLTITTIIDVLITRRGK